MSEEQQLDRSVLQSKKTDELRAIAAAVGVSLPSRATKATTIDHILRSTGVTVSEQSTAETVSEQRPKRARVPRTRAAQQAEQAQQVQAQVATPLPLSPAPPPVPASGTNGNGDGAVSVPALPAVPPASREGAPTGAVSVSSTTTPATVPAGREAKTDEERAPRPDVRGDRNGRGFDSYAAEGGPSNSRARRNRNRRNRERGVPGGGSGGANSGGVERGGERFERDRSEQAEPQFHGEPVAVAGLLELRDEGFGFLRTNGYLPSPKDVYVPVSQVRKYGLRKGDWVEGKSRPATSSEKFPALLQADRVSGLDVDVARERPKFEDLTPLFPDQKLVLEVPGDPTNLTARIVDLMSPIGKGQRGLIVSPPKAGKTTIMKQIAHSIEANNPEVYLMVLLVDERPEEVTDMRRSVKGEVIASTFDRPADEHTRVAELCLDRAKRMVEQGIDVVIILDGITRLARAYNLAAPASGRILSGGVDSGALYPPKRFFGAARNIEEGGSLTILATALVETGSTMDTVIFEEFKGTGNMELRLDRRLAERRLYPAIDPNGSSTRHEELLFDRTQLNQVWKLRRVLNALAQDGNSASGLELLMDKIKATRSNDEFLAEIAKGPTPAGA